MHAHSFQSSGNLAADRRYEYAKALMQDGDPAAAADLFGQTLELAPHWAACWFAYGEALETSAQSEKAIAAFEHCLSLAPEDPFGAGLHLCRLGARQSAETSGYVASLFDQYAPRFNAHLVETLKYRGPELLRNLLDKIAGQNRHFDSFFDLGCGTGLMAQALKGRFAHAKGVDLSAKMIAQAEKTGLYQELVVGELTQFLRAQPEGSAELILAADVFVYCGALDDIFAAARTALSKTGLFGFSVQSGTADFRLGEDYRFTHSASYIERLAVQTGFVVKALEPRSTRQDRGQDVPGLIAMLGTA